MSRAALLALLTLPTLATGQADLGCHRFDTQRCDRYDAEFAAAAQLFDLPAQIFKAIAWTESRCKPRAKSRIGAMGVMQLMPGTFAGLKGYTGARDPWDPVDSIVTGGLYFTQLVHRYGGPTSASAWIHAIVAYNGGPGAVPSPPSPAADDWDKFSTASTHYADRVMSVFLCLGGPPPTGL